MMTCFYRLSYEELERDSDRESRSDTDNYTKQTSPAFVSTGAATAGAAVSPERMQQMEEHPRWSLRFVEQSLGTERLIKKELIQYLRDFASLDFLRKWKLLGTSRSLRRSLNCDDLISAFKVRVAWILLWHSPQLHTSISNLICYVTCINLKDF